MKQFYVDRKFRADSLALIKMMSGVLEDYRRQGFVLTLRQLYYQLVSRNVVPNTERSYKNVGSLLNDARLAGLLDWDMIEDRTRSFIDRSKWADGSEILQSVAAQFHADLWEGQERRVFLIVEKEALVGVFENICEEYDIPLLAARGYPSVSVVREFAMTRLRRSDSALILHFGDHDPSGIDMTRDLTDRIDLFNSSVDVELRRIALNMEQIEEHQPPPNPAKVTDSRFTEYARLHGTESWELDALTPQLLVGLVEEHVRPEIDEEVWEERKEFIDNTKAKLLTMANTWEDE